MKRILTIVAAALAPVLIGGVAFACVTNGITSSAQCGEQITWTAYLNSGDTPDWGQATQSKPSGVSAAPTNTNGVKFTTTTFVPGTAGAGTWYITETATQGSQRGTTYYASQYVDAHSACNPTPSPTVTKTINVPVPGPTVSVPVPGPTTTTTVNVPVPGPTVSVPVPGPTVTKTTTVTKVVVHKVKVIVRPKTVGAHFVGPCGDPFYRAVFVNPLKHRVGFVFEYTAFSTGQVTSIHKSVAAGKSVSTRYVHVLGGTLLAVRRSNGQAVSFTTAAAAGEYADCKR